MHSLNKPLISILTTSWNRERHLKKLANSLQNLKYKNFEWIIANDGSKDNTDLFIRYFSKKVKFKIIYLKSNVRIGKSTMVNKMLNRVSGQYIIECDSDDYFLINSLNDLIKLLPKKEIKNFAGICAQNIDTDGKSQTFKRKVPKLSGLYKWEELGSIIDGDATIMVKKKLFKNKRFLEVDFLITESSLLNRVYKNKYFILTPKIVKIMDRYSNNSVSFGNKLSYTRGSFYTLIMNETNKVFEKKKFLSKLITVINFWRYSLHGDMSFSYSIKKFKPFKKNKLYIFLYFFSVLLFLRDRFLNKVEKTHVEFEKNKKIVKIKIENL